MVTADVFLLPCLQSHICIWFWILGGITIRCFITFSLISSMMWYFDRILFWDVKHHFTCCKCCSFTVVSDIQLSNPARVSVHICSVRTSLIACQFTLYLYKRLLRYIFSSLLFCCRLRILFLFSFHLHSDWCPHLSCCHHKVSTIVPSGFLQVSVGLDNLQGISNSVLYLIYRTKMFLFSSPSLFT